MKNRYFPVRLLNLLLILAIIAGYQVVALDHARAEEKAQKKYMEEQQKAAAQQAQQAQQSGEAGGSESGSSSPYNDGTFTGSAQGYDGMVEMKVVIKNGVIESIEKVSAPGEDAAYWDMASDMIPQMVVTQDPNVDTVSGATMTSVGIKNAVITALQQALK